MGAQRQGGKKESVVVIVNGDCLLTTVGNHINSGRHTRARGLELGQLCYKRFSGSRQLGRRDIAADVPVTTTCFSGCRVTVVRTTRSPVADGRPPARLSPLRRQPCRRGTVADSRRERGGHPVARLEDGPSIIAVAAPLRASFQTESHHGTNGRIGPPHSFRVHLCNRCYRCYHGVNGSQGLH